MIWTVFGSAWCSVNHHRAGIAAERGSKNGGRTPPYYADPIDDGGDASRIGWKPKWQ